MVLSQIFLIFGSVAESPLEIAVESFYNLLTIAF
jgi:hypothetical protein